MSTAKDPLRYFRVEAREISQEMGQGALQLEKEVTPERIAHLLRLAHTLKGAAGVVKQRDIAQLAHNLEDVLAPFRGRMIAFPRDKTDQLLALVDTIAASVAALEPAAERPVAGTGAAAPDERFTGLRADNSELDALLHDLSEANIQLRNMRHTVSYAEQAKRLAVTLVDRQSNHKDLRDGEALRDLVTKLERSLADGLDQAERDMQHAHAAAEGLRLMPASLAFTALERAVRDAAGVLGKTVRFEGKGGEIKLDARVLGLMQGALVQLVRNAVVHGIENDAERRRAAKPGQGTVAVEVSRRGDRVAFVCSDDGRGIDLEAVARAARDKGLVPPPGPDGLLQLVLQGGLTTAQTVSELSGRGIGMDVAREVAARLGGAVSARTSAGQGTSIELVVPVTLSSLEALLVESDGVVAAIPLAAVQGSLRLRAGDITRAADRDSILHDGRTVPFMALSQALGLDTRGGRRGNAQTAVVLRGANGQAGAIGVDRLLGAAGIVARQMPGLAFAESLVSGACLDAEGVPQLVLEPDALVRASHHAIAAPLADAAKPPILVIDDSLTTRVLEQSILESAGYEVDLATCAEEGLEKARRRRYGLFLVDVEMPGMDGFTFVETTRADPDLRSVPAILVSSRNAPEDRRRGAAAGAHAYVVKGEFDQGEVLKIIHRLLE